MFGYFTAVRDSPEGNMALFMALFIVCFVEVMLVKVITEEARMISRRPGFRRRRQFHFPGVGVGSQSSDGSGTEEEEYSAEESGSEEGASSSVEEASDSRTMGRTATNDTPTILSSGRLITSAS